MPTGYTADIGKGITFDQFILGCARAFGACVTLRDEPAGAGIPDVFEPSNFNREEMQKAEARLLDLQTMGDAEATRQALADWDRRETARIGAIAEKNALRTKYEAMLKQVNAWTPPTAEHVGLKAFMLEQINGSIDFDCGTKYYEQPTEKLSGPDWRANQMGEAVRAVEYHKTAHNEEVARADGRTAWVRALRASLEKTP